MHALAYKKNRSATAVYLQNGIVDGCSVALDNNYKPGI